MFINPDRVSIDERVGKTGYGNYTSPIKGGEIPEVFHLYSNHI